MLETIVDVPTTVIALAKVGKSVAANGMTSTSNVVAEPGLVQDNVAVVACGAACKSVGSRHFS